MVSSVVAAPIFVDGESIMHFSKQLSAPQRHLPAQGPEPGCGARPFRRASDRRGGPIMTSFMGFGHRSSRGGPHCEALCCVQPQKAWKGFTELPGGLASRAAHRADPFIFVPEWAQSRTHPRGNTWKERKKGKFSIEEGKKYSAGPWAGNSFPEEQGHAARSRGLTELREARPVT